MTNDHQEMIQCLKKSLLILLKSMVKRKKMWILDFVDEQSFLNFVDDPQTSKNYFWMVTMSIKLVRFS